MQEVENKEIGVKVPILYKLKVTCQTQKQDRYVYNANEYVDRCDQEIESRKTPRKNENKNSIDKSLFTEEDISKVLHREIEDDEMER